mgnify:CR=1 FL=1
MMVLGSSILAMGMCNIHAHSGVTEGGVLGLTLLLEHLFAISPALSALILNVLCYALGWRTLGRGFLLTPQLRVCAIPRCMRCWSRLRLCSRC